ncbi:MAG: NADP-dependent oxidoreductase [Proteobacteria bacterium]|nr:NADP-dependent oxidoreductase [Pseudomonadota bacterium]
MSSAKSMKAIVFETFGEASVLEAKERPIPKVNEHDVLIKISHTSVNPVDWKIRKGYLKDMFKHNFPVIPGWDAAGTVVEIGKEVTKVKIGDRVAAYTRLPEVGLGTYAEYIALPEDMIANVSTRIGFDAAAGIPLVGLTALQALTQYSKVRKGDRVLILNASGGVGSLAVQIAKNLGALVDATTGSKNIDYVKSLGAHHVIDYTQGDFHKQASASSPEGYDFILDAMGGASLEAAWKHLKKGGQLVSIVDSPDQRRAESLGVNAVFHFVSPDGLQLQSIFDQIEKGSLRVPPFNVKSINEAIQAQLDSEGHRTRGKIVLAIDF